MPSGNQSGDQSGDQSGNKSGDKSANKLGTAPRDVPTLGETTDADIKSEYLEAIPYNAKVARRFPTPWSVEDNGACFIVKDRNGYPRWRTCFHCA